jgi:hypothetical protein
MFVLVSHAFAMFSTLNVTTFTRLYQNWSMEGLLAVYGSTGHSSCDNFFLLSSVCGLEKKQIIIIIITGWLGSTWGHNFYTGTQHGHGLKLTRNLNFDSHLRIKVMAL